MGGASSAMKSGIGKVVASVDFSNAALRSSVHYVRVQVVQPRDCRSRRIGVPASLEDLDLELRVVLAASRPLTA